MPLWVGNKFAQGRGDVTAHPAAAAVVVVVVAVKCHRIAIDPTHGGGTLWQWRRYENRSVLTGGYWRIIGVSQH